MGLWGCRGLRADGTAAWVAGVASGRHADGDVVELPEREARAYVGDETLALAHLDSGGTVVGIQVAAVAAPKAPALWFAELPEENASPPATNLLVFTGHDVQPGRLLDATQLRESGVRARHQLGAIRMYPGTGEVDQLYVTPQWRRRSIGTALTVAAGILNYARGWNLPWGDGQRTSDGDRLVTASFWRHRAAPLTHLMPPMTPFDER